MTIEIAGSSRSAPIDSRAAGRTSHACPADRSAALSARDRRPVVPPCGRRGLPLRLAYPDGTVVGAADPTLPTMVICTNPDDWPAGSAATV